MEKIKTVIDKNSTKEFIQGAFAFAFVSLGVSLLIAAVYITFGVINNAWSDFLSIVLVVLGGVLFLLSIVMIAMYISALNKAKNFVRTVIYDFLDEAVSFEVYREEEKVEAGKLYYNDFIDYKETKNYIILRLKNNTSLVIQKEEGVLDLINSKGIPKQKFIALNRR